MKLGKLEIGKEAIGIVIALIAYFIGRLTKQRKFTARKQGEREIKEVEEMAEKLILKNKAKLEEIKKIKDTKERLQKIKELLEEEK